MSPQRTKAPTIIDIATEAGVSKSAVSRALLGQGEVSAETRERVERAANKLGYVANAMARGLVSSSTKTLGVVLRDVTRPFYASLYAAMQARAEESGYRIVTSTSAGELNVAGALGALRSLVSLQVDGLIIASAKLPSERIVPFIERVPIVVAGRRESHARITSVYCDDVEGGALLADHLIDLGHRRIAVAVVEESYSLSQHTRGTSMISRIRARGGEAMPMPVPDDSSVRDVVDSVLAEPVVTALMCPTDMAMMDALDQLRLRDRSAPADLSVTGYDGLGPLASPFLGLSTFRQPVEEIGHISVDLLIQAIAGETEPGQHVALSGHVLSGRTTATTTTR
jgi:DNA-binding LacI/PurR family transcriptional regulator